MKSTSRSEASLLVALPSEIQSLISANLNRYDLNRLCLTCKTFEAIVLPRIYERVVVRAPPKWSRLPSLEGLLGSTGDGLKYTTQLSIETQQAPLRKSQLDSDDFRDPEVNSSESTLQSYLPQTSASNALNALIRILISKLPKARLKLFFWSHCCEVDVATVDLLFKRQNASLRNFSCNRYSSSCDLRGSTIDGIHGLSIESMDLHRFSCVWAASMLSMNAESLDYLHLGATNRIAQEYALQRRPPYDEVSTSLANQIKNLLSEIGPDPLIHLSLDSLILCGLDFGKVLRGEIGLDIDLNNLTILELESCTGLAEAFNLLVGQRDSPKLALGALKDFFLRLEQPVQTFSADLEIFLTSIRGLTQLSVLIDGASAYQNLKPILKVHGESLHTLVWDERRGPRTQLGVSTSLLPTKAGNLKIISQYCRFLHVLAIPLDWEAISSSDKHHLAISSYLRKMTSLEALIIRNLPEISGRVAMPMDYFVKSLAAMFIDIAVKAGRPDSLRTIAIGAPLYRDLHIGTHHVVHTVLSDYLRFRVYDVDYNYPSRMGRSPPILCETVKGAANTSEEQFSHENLLYSYWLG